MESRRSRTAFAPSSAAGIFTAVAALAICVWAAGRVVAEELDEVVHAGNGLQGISDWEYLEYVQYSGGTLATGCALHRCTGLIPRRLVTSCDEELARLRRNCPQFGKGGLLSGQVIAASRVGANLSLREVSAAIRAAVPAALDGKVNCTEVLATILVLTKRGSLARIIHGF